MLSQSAISGLAISGPPTSDANKLSSFGKLKKIGQQLRILQQCQAFCPGSRPNCVPSTHLTASECCFPLSMGPIQGGDTIACGGGGGDPIPTKGQTLWYSMYTKCNPYTVAINSPPTFASASCLSFSAFLHVAGRTY
jgi:hypothetical protein